MGKNPFAVILPDVIVDDKASDLKKDNLSAMVRRFESTGAPQIMVEKVPQESVSSYGIVDIEGKILKPGESCKIKQMVEKPKLDEAPSDLAVVGRYVLPAEIWSLFKKTPIGAGGEFQLTDTIELLMHMMDIEAYNIVGKSHDCGNKLGYVETFIEYALRNPDFGATLKDYVKKLVK